MLFQAMLDKLTAAGLLALAFAGSAQSQERYVPSADGQEVVDSRTGLIWRRCAEGMSWKGKTCVGDAFFGNHASASARAIAAVTPTEAWRIPTMKELSGIVAVREAEPGKAAIDAAVFPATPLARFWTSSSVGRGYFMFVGFVEGSVGEGERNSPGALRLVRSAK